MVWAGSAQEDHASGETGSSSDGTFWHITSVLNTGAGPSPARTRSLRARPCKRAPACPELSRPSRLRRSHLQRSTRRSPSVVVRVVDRGQRPLPELVEQSRLILPRVGDGDWVEGVEVIRAFLGHDQVGGGTGGWLGGGHGAEHCGPVERHHDRHDCEPPRSTSSRGNQDGKARPAVAGQGPDRSVLSGQALNHLSVVCP